MHVDTLKRLLRESQIISLVVGQTLYEIDSEDKMVYFVLFGKVALYQDHVEHQRRLIGKVSLGWTLGEEVLFDSKMIKKVE
jgi:hypothetical protein